MDEFIPKDRADGPIYNALKANNLKQALKLVEKRIAKKRTEHLEALKIYIRSRSSVVADKDAVLVALEELVAKKSVLEDLDDIDLYDDALAHVLPNSGENWARIIGELRWQSVKATPKNEDLGLKCFEACLSRDDLEHAQQIASSLEKSFSNKHQYIFWNITALFLRSISQDLPEDKRSLWGRLSLLQINKLATATKQAGDSKTLPVRAIQTPQELLLLHRILTTHGKIEDRLSYLQDPYLGPESTVAKGDWELWRDKLGLMENAEQWQELLKTTRRLIKRARTKDDNGEIVEARMADWVVWNAYLRSSRELQHDQWGKEVSAEIDAHLDPASGVDKTWRRNASLARLTLVFEERSAGIKSNSSQKFDRVTPVIHFLQQYGTATTAYIDLRAFVEVLEKDERDNLLEILQNSLAGKTEQKDAKKKVEAALDLGPGLKTFDSITRHVNAYKLIYLLKSSVPEHQNTTKNSCRVSSVYSKSALEKLAKETLTAYGSAISDDGSITKTLLVTDRHPADDLCVLTAMCLMKLSIAHRDGTSKSLQDPNISYLLQAAALLESAWPRSKSNFQISLLLARLYSWLGCGSLAARAHQRLGLKGIQLDTLSYPLIDRISSFHPHSFTHHPNNSKDLRTPIKHLQKQQKVYRNASSQVTQNSWRAFENGSYNSIFQLKEFSDTMSRTASAVTSVVETKKVSRLLEPDVSLIEKPCGDDILPKFPEQLEKFPDTNDYETFPNFETTQRPHFETLSRCAPGPSNFRCRMNLIIENLKEVPDKASNIEAKNTAWLTFKKQVYPIFQNLLDSEKEEAETKITPSEQSALKAYGILAHITIAAFDSERWKQPTFQSEIDNYNDLLIEILVEQMNIIGAIPESVPAFWKALHEIYSAHELGSIILRFHAYLSTIHKFLSSPTKERDVRNPQPPPIKNIISEKTKEKADELLKKVIEKSKGVKKGLDESGWIDRVLDGILQNGKEGDEVVMGEQLKEVIGEDFLEEWASLVIESWRESVIGFSYLKGVK